MNAVLTPIEDLGFILSLKQIVLKWSFSTVCHTILRRLMMLVKRQLAKNTNLYIPVVMDLPHWAGQPPAGIQFRIWAMHFAISISPLYKYFASHIVRP